MKKFLRDLADSFAYAALVVVVVDAEALISAGSKEQAIAAAAALGRAALIAGVKEIAPRVLAARNAAR